MMKNGLHSRYTEGIFSEWISGIHIAVKPGEVAAGNIDPEAMSPGEDIAGGGQINFIFIKFTRDQRLRIENGFSVSGPDSPFGHVDGQPVGMHIHQFHKKSASTVEVEAKR